MTKRFHFSKKPYSFSQGRFSNHREEIGYIGFRDSINDVDGTTMGDISGENIFDREGKLVPKVIGNDVFDPDGNRILGAKTLREFITGYDGIKKVAMWHFFLRPTGLGWSPEWLEGVQQAVSQD